MTVMALVMNARLLCLCVSLCLVAVECQEQCLYVCSTDNDLLVVYNSSGGLVTTVSIPGSPTGIIASGDYLYVAQSALSTLAVLDYTQLPLSVTGSVNVSMGSNIQGLAVDPSGTQMFVASAGGDNLLIRLVDSGSGFEFSDVLAQSAGRSAWGLNVFDGSVLVSITPDLQVFEKSYVNASAPMVPFTAASELLNGPSGIAVSGDTVYVMADVQHSLLEFNATGWLVRVVSSDAGVMPYDIKIGPDGLAYVSSSGTDQILAFNLTTGAQVGIFATASLKGNDMIAWASCPGNPPLPTPTPPPTPAPTDVPVDIGAVVGGIVGGVALLILAVAVCVIKLRKPRAGDFVPIQG